jgi:pyruvate dehydrogenase phosphatase regulatory subunit
MNELSNTEIHLSPFMYKKINVGYASDVMAMSFTHTGERGYCLYVPSEYAIHVYESLMQIGHDYGIRDVGNLTQRWMRIERFIPFWAEELSNFVTPFEAGMDHFVNLFKHEDFIGKAALKKQKQTGVKKRLVMFLLEDIDVDKDIW